VSDAIELIRKSHPKAKLESLVADLAQAHVAGGTTRRFRAVDILVNNLGTYRSLSYAAGNGVTDARRS